MTFWTDDRNHVLDDVLAALWFGAIALLIGVPPGQFPHHPAAAAAGREPEPRQCPAGFRPAGGAAAGLARASTGCTMASFRPATHGRNYAVLLPVWDWVFGTGDFQRQCLSPHRRARHGRGPGDRRLAAAAGHRAAAVGPAPLPAVVDPAGAAPIIPCHPTGGSPMLRRRLLAATMAAAPVAALAQSLRPVPPAADAFQRLQGGVPHHLTPEQEAQRVVDSPAPPGPPGHWVPRAALPVPRSEMAWATALDGRMHVVGGYGEGRVDRGYHHVYDPAGDHWFEAAPLPRGANHVAVAAHDGRVYAFGGFIEQNRNPDDHAYAYDPAAIAGPRSARCPGRAAPRRRWR